MDFWGRYTTPPPKSIGVLTTRGIPGAQTKKGCGRHAVRVLDETYGYEGTTIAISAATDILSAEGKDVGQQALEVFDKIDRNNDGKLDIEKIIAKLHAGLNKIDTSDDGFIDKAEFKAMTSPPPAKPDASAEQLEDVQAELARLREALEKLAESLQDRK